MQPLGLSTLLGLSVVQWIGLSVAAGLVIFLVPLLLLGRHWHAARRRQKLAAARAAFHQRREWLEAHFMSLAAGSGKPRGLRWVNCDFRDEVEFAHDCETGELTALVGVTISFEAVEGGGMEEVEAVSNLRAATAVFQFDGRKWTTRGRAIMNLEPDEAIAHFRGKLVRLAE